MESQFDLGIVQGFVLITLGLLGFLFSILAFRNRIRWGSARRMGIPAIIFTWMGLIYWLVLFEGAYGVVSVLVGFPIWIDMILFFLILTLSIMIYIRLRRREKFSREVFLAIFLVPLSIPCINTAAQIVPRTSTTLSPGYFKTAVQPIGQWLGKTKVGPVKRSTPLRMLHMEHLYNKQEGMDAICKVPVPSLYVGPIWSRRFNPAIEIDHRIPRAKGGSDQIANLQLTHRGFNRAKRDLTGYDLRQAKRHFCPP